MEGEAKTEGKPVERPALPKGAIKGKAAKKMAAKTPRPKGLAKAHDRTGKRILRAKPGQPGKMAAKGLHLLVVRVPKAIHKRVWSKASKAKVSVAAWLNGVIAKAAK
jgi:hypothetical protein